MTSSSRAAAALATVALGASCALVGYDLDGYGPGDEGGGGEATSASRATSASSHATSSHGTTTSSSASSAGGGSSATAGGGGGDGGQAPTCSCDDRACAATHACGLAPQGAFQGPIAFSLGPPGTVACGGAFPTRVLPGRGTTFLVPPSGASCADCECDTGACGHPTLTLYTDPSCTQLVSQVSWDGACLGIAAMLAIDVAPQPFSAPGCTPRGGKQTAPPAVLADEAVACTGPANGGGGCGDAEACYPIPDAPFALCIYADGDVDCPGALAKTLIGKVDDQRACSPCQCGAPNATCPTQIDIFKGPGCTSPEQTIGPMQCTFFSMDESISARVQSPCQTSGGMPSGEVTLGHFTTVCCPPP